ncbi:MAG: aminotransferase class I/II-fold pyridoxal phosphate-dependent enzyme [Clostridiales Family XIII bacterium]|jgi:DNA-binding transcriptional MocR family regulator|nr:aminotransferase class I/II-fold pyridoxal phosphate-dependent enzyme [Clostridiales Family XIII bacterium]
MREWHTLSTDELLDIKSGLEKQLEEYGALGLDLDLSRGKPSSDMLDLSNEIAGGLDGFISEDGADVRNYGILTGLPEMKRLFSALTGVPEESMVIGGNSSLALMYQSFVNLYLFGATGGDPWMGQKVKILCPSPGYDRHFGLASDFGAELIAVPMTDEGPDMDVAEKLAAEDEAVKGIWVVPLYSNPGGAVTSGKTAKRLAEMKTAAPDFRIFWDNAYGIHHIWEEHEAPDILKLCLEAGCPERAYVYFSTSKINFPGAGVSFIAAGPEEAKKFAAHMNRQMISYDKINQLRTVKFFGGDPDVVRAHMKRLADRFRPKFETVFRCLSQLDGLGILEWKKPLGGYFVAIDTLPGCAKRVVELAKSAGVTLTDAGATWPYGDDPNDSNIRIAPSYADGEQIEKTMEILLVCIKLASAEKLTS